MEVYLDNCASTPIYDCVIEEMIKSLKYDYANPSALHKIGFDIEQKLKKVSQIIAKTLKVTENEIIFTSGATESNNSAIISSVNSMKRYGKHIISTSIEHPSVKKVLENLEENGYEITYLKIENGNINLDELKKSLREDTILATFMLVNNEVGTVLPVNEMAEIIKTYNSKILVHIDATQGYLKYDINIKNIDFISVSAHKIHGPKGVGFLYINKEIKYIPLILGGQHQNGKRAGTLNVSSIVGMGKCIEEYYSKKDSIFNHLNEIKKYFIENILQEINEIKINSKFKNTAPHVCSITFNGIKSEVLLHSLEEKGIYVSAGSACSSHSKKVSSVLVNLGLTKEEADSTIRFSFSENTTKQELDYTIKMLKETVKVLRKFIRR